MERAMEDTTKSTDPEETPEVQAPQAEAEDTELEALDDLDDVDFDLDEVENKIAPLALAANELPRW
ncbi:ammosamide/lymphostin RiPP family protein [Streptomyces sp. NPDC019396]|uniref:ammosamide/lymphostin RiPP family protein n=1 Tax=Streptomyces sp. NPDC019396 TaxID=3154687 RepID=UPI0033C5117E